MNDASRSRAKTEIREVWVGALEAPMSIEPLEVDTAFAWSRVLSPRELDVALLAAQGHSNKQVARTLDLAEGTVKVHMHNILQKLGTGTRYTLVLWMRDQNFKQSA